MRETGRNLGDHNESEEKDKDGIQKSGKQKGSNKTKLIIQGLVAIGILFIVISMFLNIRTSGNEAPENAPEGKVWSPEHGHWHDAE